MSVPEPGSIEDVLLQQREITLPCTDAKYPRENYACVCSKQIL